MSPSVGEGWDAAVERLAAVLAGVAADPGTMAKVAALMDPGPAGRSRRVRRRSTATKPP